MLEKVAEFVLAWPHASALGTALVHRYMHVARQIARRTKETTTAGPSSLTSEQEHDAASISPVRLFATVKRVLKQQRALPAFAPLSIRLYIQAADMANQCRCPDLTYELFEEVPFLFLFSRGRAKI